jgi:hypothetical protein
MLSRPPVALDKAVVKARPVVDSRVAESLGRGNAEVVPVGRPKVEVRGEPCEVAR